MLIRQPRPAPGTQSRGRAAARVAGFAARRVLVRVVVAFILVTLFGMLLFAQDPTRGVAILL
jgi:hypothetical protein